MYAATSNEQLTGFRIGRRTTGGTELNNPEKALPQNQEGFFSKGMNFSTRSGSNKAIGWFNEFAEIVGGINTIIQDNTNTNQNQTQEKPNNGQNTWKLFMGISIIALITLTLIFIIKK